MASRRKYREPKGYFTGGRVVPDPAADVPAAASAPPPPVEPEASEPDALEIAVRNALRAEQIVKEAARLPLIEREINALPISDEKKSWLRERPELVTDPFLSKAVAYHHANALRAGIEDDTEEMKAAVLAAVDREMTYQREMSVANVKVMASSPAMMPPERVAHQDRVLDVEPHADLHRPPAPVPAPALMPERRKSIPMSAPVSRDVPTASGKRTSDNGMTLSAEERAIARNSFGPVNGRDLTNAEKEYLYARNKRKYQELKAKGHWDK